MSAYPITDNRLGEWVRRTREEQGLRLRDLANKAGVSKHTIQRWETGEDSPMLETVHAVLGALGYRLPEPERMGD